MTFTAIDFETAHASFPCEIGLTVVENGQITESRSWLIKPACFPYMNPWNERVHHIRSVQLVNACTFEELWGTLKPWFEDQYVVAHNAAFDMRVLKSSLEYYDLAIPYFDFFCSVQLSRKAWKELPSHSLDILSNYHNISFQHHRAGDDARACAIITLHAFEKLGVTSIENEFSNSGLKLKRFN